MNTQITTPSRYIVAQEFFPKDKIDMMCSITPKQLYKALYSSLDQAQQSNADLNKSCITKSKYKKNDCLVYLEYVIGSCKSIQKNNYKWSAKYEFSEKTPTYGRKYVKIFGIQKLERKLRGFLTSEKYTDIDMKNAHPCILKHLIKTHCPAIKTPILDSYCNDRDAFFKDKAVTKTDILKSLNMYKSRKDAPELIKDFITELQPVRDFFWLKYPDLQAVATDGWNTKCSLVNKIMCIEEDRLLESAISHLNIKNPVRMFDGFMPLRSELPPDSINILNKLTEEVGIVWDEKNHETFIFPENVVVIEKQEPKCLIDIKKVMVNNDMSYGKIKKKFEESRFIVTTPLCYATEVKKNGEIVLDICDKTKFTQKTENWYYTHIDKDSGESSQRPFMIKWYADTSRRTYEFIDFIPPPTIAPPNTYNLYTGMAYQNITGVKPCCRSKINVLLNHLKLLSGDDNQEEVYQYQLKWFAHMLQFPGVMPRTAIVWNSPQGAGKNIFSNGFADKIIGKKSIINTEDAEQFIGKWRNVSNKFFGIYNEASSRDTFGADGKIKALISEDTLSWEAKGKDTITVNNFLRLLILTNKDNGIKIESGAERRFQVVQINVVQPDKKYFKAIADAWDNPSIVLGFANYLLNEVDLTGFDPQRDRVETELYRAMKSVNIPPREQWLVELLTEIDEVDDDNYRWKPLELYTSYCKFMEEKSKNSKNNDFKPESNAMFGRNIKNKKWIDAIIPYVSGKSVRYYNINREKLAQALVANGVISEEMLPDNGEVDLE